MEPGLTWLDFDETDRRKALQAIELLREKDTLDELGFGSIRDAFSDRFFPGTSTIQTRARYFLFVPWDVTHDDGKRMTAEERIKNLRRRELKLIDALSRTTDPNVGGVIGKEAGRALQRMPSSIYWRGLHVWGIRRFDESIERYFRRRSRVESERAPMRTDDGEPTDPRPSDWHSSLPRRPKDLYEAASLELREEEAAFLRERVRAARPDSVLAALASSGKSEFTAERLWDAEVEACVSAESRAEIRHARLFAGCANGAQTAYGLYVARLKGGDYGEESARFEAALATWASSLEQESDALMNWNRDEFWELTGRIGGVATPRLRAFADAWIDVAIRAAGGERAWETSKVRELIASRERALKKSRARLDPANARARDRWRGDPNRGPMDYRWTRTRGILNDILRALSGGSSGPRDDDA